ncbi:MAG: DUF5659 domain-containing protein [Candidatus Omnitrophota bacterium]|jgi:hypothetical protein
MKKEIIENELFKTSDISLIASLCCYGCQVEDIDKSNRAKVIFLVKKSKNFDSLIRRYFAHQLKVEPLGFFNYLKEIKTRIYNIS